MKRLPILSFGTCLIVLCCLFFACKKTSSPVPTVPPPLPPAISTVSPMAGEVATTVTITGKGFSAMLNKDSVFFNGRGAVIISANDSQLVVSVPSLAGTGNITVKVNGVPVTGPSFTYNYQYVVSTFAGSGVKGSADGVAAVASFRFPYGIAVDGSGNLYVADAVNSKIRKISGGLVSTLAGHADNSYGSADGTGGGASFNYPAGIAADKSGNLYVSDQLNGEIRLVTSGAVVSTLAGSSVFGSADGAGAAASFNFPSGIAVSNSGILYVADHYNHTIRSLTSGVVSTFAGNVNSPGWADGVGAAAKFVGPKGLAVDSNGTVYVSDANTHTIRVISPGVVVSTLAGSPAQVQGSADGAGAAASFSNPNGLALDGKGNLYVADFGNNTIRKIVIKSGLVSTIAGNVHSMGSADGTGSAASFYGPTGIAIDGGGNLYVSEAYNNKIRKITLQ